MEVKEKCLHCVTRASSAASQCISFGHLLKMLYNYSLGNYLPKRKGVSAYISDVHAYISDFANKPENE